MGLPPWVRSRQTQRPDFRTGFSYTGWLSKAGLAMLIFWILTACYAHAFLLPGLSDAENAHFSSVRGFEQAIRQSPVPVDKLIASTWRNKETLFELQDRTPGHRQQDHWRHAQGGIREQVQAPRQREVEAWLKPTAVRGRGSEWTLPRTLRRPAPRWCVAR